jgi:MFS family permease
MGGTLAGAAVALAATGIPGSPVPLLLVAAAVFGFTVGVTQPLTMSWLAESTPRGRRGTAMSLRLAGNRLSQSAIPTGLGLLASATGPAGVLLASAGGLALATGMAVSSNKKPPPQTKGTPS